ncbi:ArsR family transcriptional regulator [Rhizohabitans arisaemae]|uniref:ArsR family transcriptional regulator n=1 Tax=Rhizohabitans arisaemae TaxID=2720610 RepID=UPI0024B06B35|nr:ArsR family transcriptional regulator [Rhizohabitans arisaemae]
MLPIFRSRHQVELLALLYLQPDQEFTLTELAGRIGVPLTTLQREVGRLLEADLIEGRRVGRAHVVRAKVPGRYARPLTELLTLAFGPHIFIEREFSAIRKVDAVAVFGSWATRYQGEPGPPPNDIDVLVVGRPTRADVYDAAERVERRIGMPVNPVLITRDRWREAADPLVQQIQSSPIVWVKELAEETA